MDWAFHHLWEPWDEFLGSRAAFDSRTWACGRALNVYGILPWGPQSPQG